MSNKLKTVNGRKRSRSRTQREMEILQTPSTENPHVFRWMPARRIGLVPRLAMKPTRDSVPFSPLRRGQSVIRPEQGQPERRIHVASDTLLDVVTGVLKQRDWRGGVTHNDQGEPTNCWSVGPPSLSPYSDRFNASARIPFSRFITSFSPRPK